MKRLLAAAAGVLALSGPAAAGGKVAPLFSHDLQGLPGKEGSLLMVEFAPGQSDPIHRHNANVFVYVLEGAVVMQVKGGPVVTVHEGQTFYEGPSDIHLVGRNASGTRPAKFLAFFVKEKGTAPVVPAQ